MLRSAEGIPTQADFDDSTRSAADEQLVSALRRGDEAAFAELVDRYHTALVRLATMYVPNRTVAEDVAQETWLGVVRGIDRFEGRSSLKTWIFHILVNRAKTRGEREGRTIPFSSLFNAATAPDEPVVDPDRFLPADHPDYPGHWTSNRPTSWNELPESHLLSDETRACIMVAVEKLPPAQREVITLRDIDGWTSEEVCDLLQISEGNQRVLLHRARSKVRGVLEQYLKVD
jgi:RNA polymerase sigma-70 factor (ECF subfamily)